MVLLTNPQTADLQQRIQNSSFGSPDYLQGFTGTMPGYQQNLLANNFQPGLITRDFSGGATSMNPSGVANYLSYTPGVPPQAVNNNTMLPIVPMVNAAVRQGGGDRGPMQNQPDPTYNPNLIGAYFGYNNPDYEASPYGEDANVLGDFIEAIQRKKVSTVAKIKEIADGGYSAPEGTTGPGGVVGGGSQPQGPYGANAERVERERVAKEAKDNENQSGGYSPNQGTTGTGGGINPNQGPRGGGNNTGGNNQGSSDGQGGVNSRQGPGSRSGGW